MSALRSLLILGTLLTASGFGSDFLSDYAGPLEYQGALTFEYPEGVNPINNIEFTVDGTLSEDLLVVNVPAGWSYTSDGHLITLSDGSLSPGGVVNVGVSLNKYHEAGDYEVSAVGTTTGGETSNARGALQVGDLYILQGLEMANTYRLPLGGATLGLGLLEAFFVSRRSPADRVVDHLTGNPFGSNNVDNPVGPDANAGDTPLSGDLSHLELSSDDAIFSKPKFDMEPDIIDNGIPINPRGTGLNEPTQSRDYLTFPEGKVAWETEMEDGLSTTTRDTRLNEPTIHPDGHVTSSVEDIITRWPSNSEPSVTVQVGSDNNVTQVFRLEEAEDMIIFDCQDQLKIESPLTEAELQQAAENPEEFFKFEWLSPEGDMGIDSMSIDDDLVTFRYKVWF